MVNPALTWTYDLQHAKKIVIMNNCTNINKTNNYISAHIIGHENDQRICGWGNPGPYIQM